MDIDQRINEKANIILSRYDFWEFCKYMDSEFFTEDKEHLIKIAEKLEQVREGKIRKLAISIFPRTGKSYIITMFCAFLLGCNPAGSIMRNSYAEKLARKFSYDVRAIIRSDNFKKVFPGIELAGDKQSIDGWSTNKAKQVSYFCAGVGGAITGFGCDMVAILDDPIKNIEEGLSEQILENKWNWYTSTHKSRLEGNCAEIHIATRWSKNDIIGKLQAMEYFDDQIIIPALIDGQSSCPGIISTDRLIEVKKLTSDFIWESEYMQNPIEVKGLLFSVDQLLRFKEATNKPDGKICVIDTADKGDDYLCSIVGYIYGAFVYIVDVVFTQEPIEYTEPKVAYQLISHNVDRCVVESNAGGRAFAKNLKDLVRGRCNTTIEDKPTTINKETRILMKSGQVRQSFYFKEDYENGSEYDQFMRQLTSYVKAGKNKHDDAADGVTMLAENLDGGNEFDFA